YLTRLVIDQQRVAIHAHPDRAIGRRRQVVIVKVDQPVLAAPEGSRQEFTERPAVGVPARRTLVGAHTEAVRGPEVAVEIAEAAEVATAAAKAGRTEVTISAEVAAITIIVEGVAIAEVAAVAAIELARLVAAILRRLKDHLAAVATIELA